MKLARLLLPAVRWNTEHGFQRQWPQIERAIDRGVGGFILFGGEAAAVRDLTDEMRRRSPHPLLIGSDLERGAGQQFRGATPLPPAAALGSLDDPEITRRAGEITAREARALGIDWIYAPVADVDLEPENPIVGTRSFGSDPERVAALVAGWVRGCREGGAMSCAKHFPGHGRTVGDSHIARTSVDADRTLLEQDLAPFRAAIAAGVDALMTAHVGYPALDPSGAPATLSVPILTDLLRKELGFSGLVVTDAIIMEGLTGGGDEAGAAALALAAGCDLLLYPQDIDGVIAGLQSAVGIGRIPPSRVEEATGHLARALAEIAASPATQGWGREEDRRWALETAIRTVQRCRGEPRLPQGALRLVEVDDDVGGPFPPFPRTALPAALQRAGHELRDDAPPVVALYADIRAWKGRPGVSEASLRRVREVTDAHPDTTVLYFGHPRLADTIPGTHLLAAWGGEGIMQEAAVAWLEGETTGVASVGAGLVT